MAVLFLSISCFWVLIEIDGSTRYGIYIAALQEIDVLKIAVLEIAALEIAALEIAALETTVI